MKLVVVTPHFAPDVAPTGTVTTRLVEELAALGHTVEVITALPWYRNHRVEPGFEGRIVRREDTPWGRITRIHPFPAPDKQNFVRRALAFIGFSGITALAGARGERADGVLAVSPPLTLGLAGWAIARRRGCPFVFNVQDVYPDVAVELGVLKNGSLIALVARLERFIYERADAVTVLSEDLRQNVAAKVGSSDTVHVIPNFVDTTSITPLERENAYRREFGLEGKTVAMYAGNVGLSQAFDLLVDAAAALAHEKDIVFVINGHGAARADLERRTRGLHNIRFVDMQPGDRLPEVLAAADIHLVPLKRGLAASSVPVKTYSILAAARPIVASVDPGTEVARLLDEAGAGIAVAPGDSEAFTKAIRALADDPAEAQRMGDAGRRFVEGWASAGAVAESYERLFVDLGAARSVREVGPPFLPDRTR